MARDASARPARLGGLTGARIRWPFSSRRSTAWPAANPSSARTEPAPARV